jgi:CRP/FNR family transcriptional regulator
MKSFPIVSKIQPDKPHPCEHCFQSRFCVPIALPQEQLDRMRSIMQITVHVGKGECLFQAGEAMDKIYAVHVGSFKSVVSIPDGRQQIVGFHIPGEMMGLDGFSTLRYGANLIALEDSQACEMDLRILELAAREVPTLQCHVHSLIGNSLAKSQQDQFNLGSTQAQERLVRFLLDLSRRYQSHGLSPDDFILGMSREDIGSYLGLRLETVSRLMMQLHRDGLIAIEEHRHLRILKREALTALLTSRK